MNFQPGSGYRYGLALLIFYCVIYSSLPAFAQQGFNVQRFQPTPFYGKTIFLSPVGERSLFKSKHRFDGEWQVGILLNYQNDAFISKTNMNTLGETPSNKDLLSGDFLASLEIFDWLALGLNITFHPLGFDFLFDQTTGFALSDERETWVMGNITSTVQATLLDQQHHGIGLSAIGIVIFPTGEEEKFLGDEDVEGGATVAVDRSLGRFHVTANLGYETRQSVDFFNLTIDDNITYGTGVAFNATQDILFVSEVRGRSTAKDFFGATEQSPLELLLAGRFFSTSGVTATLGVGLGLVDGVGTSDVRIVGGLHYTPFAKSKAMAVIEDRDDDGDGIVNRLDACPDEPEDKDGVLDKDGCPESYWIKLRVYDHKRKPLAAKIDMRPAVASLDNFDGEALFEVPRPDKYLMDLRAKGFVNRVLQVVVQPTDYLVVVDAFMVPSPNPRNIKPFTGILHRKLTSRFAFDSSAVPEGYKPNLDSIIEYLKSRPDIKTVSLEGHADATGPAAYNLKLSKRRAEAVRDYLLTRGIAAERIKTTGYGEERPVAENTTPEGREKNRRVEIAFREISGQVWSPRIK